MTDLVNPDEIERLVGTTRHETEHWGRAVSAEQTVYILHSAECKSSARDLRECPYSLALDKGIDDVLPRTAWRRLQDRPVRLHIDTRWGYLLPDFNAYREALAATKEV